MLWMIRGFPHQDSILPQTCSLGIPHGNNSLGLADHTQLVWSLEGFDKAARTEGVSPNGYELLAIRFAFLKQAILRTSPPASGWPDTDPADSVTNAHLEGLRRAAGAIDMGQRVQQQEGGHDLQPQRGGKDADLAYDELRRALLWKMRREYIAFPP